MKRKLARLGAPAWARLSSGLVRSLPLGRYRAMDWLCRHATDRFIESIPGHAGLLFDCDLRDAHAREVYFMGRYGAQETALLETLISDGLTFVDAGANWGYFSLLAAERVGARGRVVAIEADPRIFRILARNAALNGFPQLDVIGCAVGSGEGLLRFAGYPESGTNWGLSRVLADGVEATTVFEVRSRALDDILDEREIRDVDLLKIDVEGAELLVLEGMKRGLASGRYRRVLLELHPRELREHGKTTGDVITILRGAGYRGWTIDHSAEFTRRAAYGRARLGEGLGPLRSDVDADRWPHVLMLAEGIAPPPSLAAGSPSLA